MMMVMMMMMILLFFIVIKAKYPSHLGHCHATTTTAYNKVIRDLQNGLTYK